MKRYLRNPIILFFVAYVLFAAGKLLFGSKDKPEATEKVATQVTSPSQPGRFAGRDLDSLWTTFDWNSVTPGKVLAEYVGTEWVNWMLWPLAIMLGIMFVQWIVRKFKGGTTTTSSIGSVFWLIVAVILAIVLAWNLGSSSNGNVSLKPVHVKLYGHVTQMTVFLPVAGPQDLDLKITVPPATQPPKGENWVGTGKDWFYCARIKSPLFDKELGTDSVLKNRPESNQLSDTHLVRWTGDALRVTSYRNTNLNTKGLEVFIWRVERLNFGKVDCSKPPAGWRRGE